MALEKLKDQMTIDKRNERLDQFRGIACYLIIAVIIILVMLVVPFVAGGIFMEDFGYYFPSTPQGWVVFWAIRAGTLVGNLAIYGLFKAQAKVNIKDNPKFKEANDLLGTLNGQRGYIPQSPKQYQARTWTTKGISMVVITAAESIVFGSLILAFDVMTFISTCSSSITSILFGIYQMLKDEVYWTDEYPRYAEYRVKQVPHEEEKEKTECLISETKNS